MKPRTHTFSICAFAAIAYAMLVLLAVAAHGQTTQPIPLDLGTIIAPTSKALAAGAVYQLRGPVKVKARLRLVKDGDGPNPKIIYRSPDPDSWETSAFTFFGDCGG